VPRKIKQKEAPVDSKRVIMTENKSMASSKPIEIPKSAANLTISQNNLDFLTSSKSDDNAKRGKPSYKATKNPRREQT
jgi:hypothetical protein